MGAFLGGPPHSKCLENAKNAAGLENSQMLTISSQSLNGANSASRRAREVPKKGKSSEFNPRNYEQVKSSPSLTVWSHEGSNLYPKIAQ